MKIYERRYNSARIILLVISLFVGLGALAGGITMIINPKLMGVDELLPYLRKLPFGDKLYNDCTFAGIMLIIVNALTNFVASALIISKKKIGVILGMIFGITLMMWISIQFYALPANFMSILYFFIGVIQCVVGIAALVFNKQTRFTFDSSSYRNIGKNKNKVVIFFSRMGYTKKLAYEKADSLGADIIELTTDEKIDGTMGFWWCGRYAMHKWEMPINQKELDLSNYDEVYIFSPIWNFSVCGPIRTFMNQYKDEINIKEFTIVHFMNNELLNVKNEIDDMIGNTKYKFTSICSQIGKKKKIWRKGFVVSL